MLVPWRVNIAYMKHLWDGFFARSTGYRISERSENPGAFDFFGGFYGVISLLGACCLAQLLQGEKM